VRIDEARNEILVVVVVVVLTGDIYLEVVMAYEGANKNLISSFTDIQMNSFGCTEFVAIH
jgi:hypothetical protein